MTTTKRTWVPLFLDLSGQRVLVVGGGEVAERKLRLLLDSGADLRVVAPEATASVQAWQREGRLQWLAQDFDAAVLSDARLVIAATDQPEVNATVAKAARAAGIWVNAVDQPEAGDVAVPAQLRRGPLTVAIGTDGAAPVLGRRLRARIESLLPERVGDLLALLQRHRAALRRRWPDPVERRRAYESLLDGEFAVLVEAGRLADAEAHLLDRLRSTDTAQAEAVGSVALVGAGPGDPALLTLAALRELQSADVIVHDRLVSDAVLALARRDAERISVGKCAGVPSIAQAQIDRLLVELARGGRRVVRLKGGDPLIFARGGEELRALGRAGVPTRIVPGITATQGCAAYAGIPLTERGQAQALRLVTAHGERDGQALDWAALAAGGETLALYMGVRQATTIQGRLLGHGLAARTPFACIENGTRTEQRVLLGRLDELASVVRDQKVASPALLLIGELALRAREHHWFGAEPWQSPGLQQAVAAA
ncbi:MAG: uroporphyrinogen-III C-methyltransferase [Xanthomonadales bacterium]|nr:uroporphyrinogen-III C-methyltransferase [Xanthomonadales bacterium]